MEIHGHCDSAFDRVKDAFIENFYERREVGASAAVSIDQRMVVDLWAGLARRDPQSPWTRNTIVNVYSASKGIAALCAHRLVDQGKLDLDAQSPATGQNLRRQERVNCRFIWLCLFKT